jgi:hypothetical protein
VFARGSEFWSIFNSWGCAKIGGKTVHGTFVLCDDGWFVARLNPGGDGRFSHVDLLRTFASIKRLILNGEYDRVAAIRTALCGFASFYMEGAPESWGPILDCAAWIVSELDSLVLAARNPA